MWMEKTHVPAAAGAAPVAEPAQQNPTCSIPLLCTLLSIMVAECESGDAVPHQHEHEHLQPHGTEQLARIAVDYSPHACRHVPDSGDIHVTYDHGGARWRSCRRFLPDGAVQLLQHRPISCGAHVHLPRYPSICPPDTLSSRVHPSCR